MNITFIIILITILTLFILTIYLFLTIERNKDNNSVYYKKLFFLRKSELKFLKAISILENKYAIIPKLNLKKIITTDNKKYKSELKNMTVDYAIFDRDYYQIILLIELSYKSNTINNQAKIDKLTEICNDAGIKFITFEVDSEKENEQYIVDKIKEIIKNIW